MEESIASHQTWHRRIAVEANNRAWELTTRERSLAEDLEMLTVAHISAWHWSQIGTELNQQRATMLLAEVHAALCYGLLARSLADSMRNFFVNRAETPDWELAFVHTIHAHAAYVAGEMEDYRHSYATARQAIENIENEEDRGIVLQTFRLVPQA